jgi:hypothetical protein
MRRRLFIVCTLGTILAVSAIAESRPMSVSAAVVSKLYNDFAWEATAGQLPKRRSLIDQPLGSLLRYFDSNLAALIVHDRECAKKTHEICRLDFLPIWDSQDPEGATVKVLQGTTLDIVSVRVIYGGNQSRELTYRMKQTQQGWRIADIQFGANRTSLVAILRSQP